MVLKLSVHHELFSVYCLHVPHQACIIFAAFKTQKEEEYVEFHFPKYCQRSFP